MWIGINLLILQNSVSEWLRFQELRCMVEFSLRLEWKFTLQARFLYKLRADLTHKLRRHNVSGKGRYQRQLVTSIAFRSADEWLKITQMRSFWNYAKGLVNHAESIILAQFTMEIIRCILNGNRGEIGQGTLSRNKSWHDKDPITFSYLICNSVEG